MNNHYAMNNTGIMNGMNNNSGETGTSPDKTIDDLLNLDESQVTSLICGLLRVDESFVHKARTKHLRAWSEKKPETLKFPHQDPSSDITVGATGTNSKDIPLQTAMASQSGSGSLELALEEVEVKSDSSDFLLSEHSEEEAKAQTETKTDNEKKDVNTNGEDNTELKKQADHYKKLMQKRICVRADVEIQRTKATGDKSASSDEFTLGEQPSGIDDKLETAFVDVLQSVHAFSGRLSLDLDLKTKKVRMSLVQSERSLGSRTQSYVVPPASTAEANKSSD